MVRRFGAVLGMACFILPSASLATGCGDYRGKTVVSLPFAEAAASLPKIEPKSEFETTAAYNARVADAMKKASSTLLIERSVASDAVKCSVRRLAELVGFHERRRQEPRQGPRAAYGPTHRHSRKRPPDGARRALRCRIGRQLPAGGRVRGGGGQPQNDR
jgi:hypothetical protein